MGLFLMVQGKSEMSFIIAFSEDKIIAVPTPCDPRIESIGDT
jgi:hypothetical protein